MSEAYTDERLAREARITDLVKQLRELAEVALPGTYSSDAFLVAAVQLYVGEQALTHATVPGTKRSWLTDELRRSES